MEFDSGNQESIPFNFDFCGSNGGAEKMCSGERVARRGKGGDEKTCAGK